MDAGAYAGVLFDALVMLDGSQSGDALACSLRAEDVRHALMVAVMNPQDTFATESAYRRAVAGNEPTFLPLFSLPDKPTGDDVRRIVREVGLFFRGVWLEDVKAVPVDVAEAATANDLFVAGPVAGAADLAAVTDLLGAHPGANVLIAVREPIPELAGALRDHDRLFVAMISPEADSAGWLPIVQAAPRRVMWGSGRSAREVAGSPDDYGDVVAQGRAFLGTLPSPFRAGVADGNGRRIFGVPSPPEPDA